MFRSLVRSLLPSLCPRTALLVIVVTVSAFGGVSWSAVTLLDRRDTLERAGRDLARAAEVLAGHGRTVMEPRRLLLDRVAHRLDGLDPAALAGGGASGQALGEAFAAPEGAVAVLDAKGRAVFGPDVTMADAAALLAGGPAGTGGGAGPPVLAARVDGAATVVFARPLRGGDGQPRGAVVAVVPPASLSAVLDALGAAGAGGGPQAGLYRLSGERLAGTGPDRWPASDDASVRAVRTLAGLPLFAGVLEPRTDVLAPWRDRLERGLAVAAVGLLALLGLAAVGWRSLRREEAAMRALADANTRLERRVGERTADLSALNQQLVAALAEKERANQAKARFLSAANHDLRQPFQALRLFHHLLDARLKDPRDRAIADKMGAALDSGETLLHSLLEVATLDAGVVKPTIAAVAVSQVMETVAAEFRKMADAKGLELRVHPTAAVVRSDPALLTRMLRDLVRNAVVYTASGCILIGCRPRGQWLRIEVWDTGPGIAAEHLDTIFEDFVQLGNPERDRSRGLGLGLAKVRRKAALLGHTVDVRSRPGQGSVFSITVPVAAFEPVAETADSAVAAEARPSVAWHILVVEDDPVQRSGMQLLLESWGHVVTAAADGTAAVQAVRDGDGVPDAIVTDFRLPGALNGVQVVTRVGEIANRPVPGIILTGDTAPERIREAVTTGCRLLHKPFTPDLLRDALAALAASPEAAGARGAQHVAA
ncbi:ATP-binding response regulator [Azospirillum sp. ST 5-10]|uniref:ATP-binding response regulator n=1 Tax=unclassified Azospirillum TaxID=2630922 RepID=UPI003F4A0BA5